MSWHMVPYKGVSGRDSRMVTADEQTRGGTLGSLEGRRTPVTESFLQPADPACYQHAKGGRGTGWHGYQPPSPFTLVG